MGSRDLGANTAQCGVPFLKTDHRYRQTCQLAGRLGNSSHSAFQIQALVVGHDTISVFVVFDHSRTKERLLVAVNLLDLATAPVSSRIRGGDGVWNTVHQADTFFSRASGVASEWLLAILRWGQYQCVRDMGRDCLLGTSGYLACVCKGHWPSRKLCRKLWLSSRMVLQSHDDGLQFANGTNAMVQMGYLFTTFDLPAVLRV